jgi:DNA-binding response OmpR family regulator
MKIKKILIVDDDPDIRIFVSTVVETMRFEPIAAKDGVEALKMAKSSPPELVILDVMMPKIEDGILTYKKFKTDKNLSSVPIIMLSAIAKKTFLHSIRTLNPQKGDDIPEPEAYMEKPPDADELSRLIKIILTGDGQGELAE